MISSPEGTAETPLEIPNTVHHMPSVSRPFGTFTNRRLFPALKRRAIVTLSLRDEDLQSDFQAKHILLPARSCRSECLGGFEKR